MPASCFLEGGGNELLYFAKIRGLHVRGIGVYGYGYGWEISYPRQVCFLYTKLRA